MGIASVGQAFVILSGGIDISLYGIAVLAATVGATSMTARTELNNLGGYQAPVLVGLLMMLVVGILLGAINGLVVSRWRVPALIATLGMSKIGYGAAQQVGHGATIVGLPESLRALGQGKVAGIGIPVIAMFVAFAVGFYVLKYTRFGRHVYAVGGDPASARLSGVNVKRVQTLVFIISGLMAALGAAFLVSRSMMASGRTGEGLELDTITAVAIGGVSIYGGRGSIIGVLFGVLIVSVLNTGLSTMGAGPDVLNTVKGGVIIAAVAADAIRRRRQQRTVME
jgi:ribose/xylose/arabinose/galactoside ABC-type transport system permease subunit